MFRMMKLRPPHGWNAVAWELAIVTLGVLIALAAQQFVDDINRRSEVRQLVGGLRGELGDMRARWEHVRNSDPCTMQRLDALDRWIATAPPDAKLASAYRPFLWNMHTGAEIGIDEFQASRAPDNRYRTAPLRGLWTHTKGGFYHDGRFATLGAVVDHYDSHFVLGLSAAEKAQLVEFLKSL